MTFGTPGPRRLWTSALPREHGAWAILLIPFFTAAVIAGRWTVPVFIALIVLLLAFVARYPLELLFVPATYLHGGKPDRAYIARLAWIYGSLAATAGLFFVLHWKLYQVLPLALVGGLLAALRVLRGRRGADHELLAELAWASGLSLSALVAWVAATGGLDSTGFIVWALNAAFFSCGILYVRSRIRVRSSHRRPEAAAMAAVALAFHFAVVIFVLALVWIGWIAPLVVVPFMLAAVRAKWGLSNKQRWFALPRLGWSEVVLSLVFAALLILSFRG